jgi:hypothetical protein
MKLTKKALTAINTLEIRLLLASALSVREYWIAKLIEANSENGKLTTIAAFLVIREKTGLKESEIIDGLKSAVLR